MKFYVKTYLKNFYYFISFPFRVLEVKRKIGKIDKIAPFKGDLSFDGTFAMELSVDCINQLELIYLNKKENIDQKNIIHLRESDSAALSEIFNILEPLVKNYLGNECFLDGINWISTIPKVKSISGNWHTDNVGNRLKCFICIKGDGSMPTLIISSIKRIPNNFTILKQTAIESLRWIGLSSEFNLGSILSANHKRGSLYIFDTQLFHRGGYNQAKMERVIFHLEFSDRRKHKLINGPIGTKDYNKFIFDKSLLNVITFEKLLDKNRCVENGLFVEYNSK